MDTRKNIRRTKQRAAKTTLRDAKLRQMLERRREELRMQVHGRMRDVRVGNDSAGDVRGQGESFEGDVHEDIDLPLIQMAAETVTKIDAALDRLEQGTYGNCSDCGGTIAEARLRALPFAVRCRDCEEARETALRRSTPAAPSMLDLW